MQSQGCRTFLHLYIRKNKCRTQMFEDRKNRTNTSGKGSNCLILGCSCVREAHNIHSPSSHASTFYKDLFANNKDFITRYEPKLSHYCEEKPAVTRLVTGLLPAQESLEEFLYSRQCSSNKRWNIQSKSS